MFIILAILLAAAPSYADGFRLVDTHALHTPPAAARSVASLAEYLETGTASDREKARAVYRWITGNIQYDVEGYFSGQFGDVGPEEVLHTRKSICQGYAGLFKQLASAMGLEAVTISGYSKGYGIAAGQKFTGGTNHAWNAVKIDGDWQLIDCTWGAGYLNATNRYEHRFNDHYFCTPPDLFVFDHLPEDSRWQLLDKPITLKEYESLVLLRPAYFRLGLDIGTFTSNTIAVSRKLKLPVRAPDEVEMTVELIRGNAILPDDYAFIQREDSLLVVRALFPQPGAYTVRLYGKERAEDGPFRWTADYRAVNDQASGELRFPKKYTVFDTRGCRIFTPFNAGLRAGKKQYFRIIIPGARKAAVVWGDTWSFFTQAGPEFSGWFTPDYGPVQVAATFEGKDAFAVLLEYTAGQTAK